MKSFISLIESVILEDKLEDSIIDFIEQNPNPPDSAMHDLADELGVQPDELETKVYKILSDFFADGRWNKEGQPEVDQDELDAGTEIEYEHTASKKFAERIAKDHLSELKDYYTRLKKMEDEGEKEEVSNKNESSSSLTEADEDVETAEDEAGSVTDAEGEVVKDSDVDKEKDLEDTTEEKGVDDKYIWNIESYTIMGIRQVFVYAGEDRISYDTYKADPYNMLMYVNKKYGPGTFKDTLKHLNNTVLNAETIELILDNDGLDKEVVDYIVDNAKAGFGMKVSIV